MELIQIRDFFPESKAYLIGISEYKAVTPLSSPPNDIRALQEVLKDKHGFSFPEVEFTEDGQRTNPLLDPTGDELLHFLEHIQCDKDDRVIIYFAGHGIATSNEKEPEGYLLPVNATPGQWDTFVPMKKVMKLLDNLECRHLLVILDCCYAGAFRWSEVTRGVGEEVPKTIYYERFRQYAKNKAWQVLTSSAHDQKALDTLRLGEREPGNGDKKDDLSPFAALLVHALQTGEADLRYGSTKEDGVITATELGFYMRQSISNALYDRGINVDTQQIPMLFPLKQHGKGEFVFLNPVLSSEGKISLENRTNDNPYKGLDAYTIQDSNLFYGRQRVLDGWQEGKTRYLGLKDATDASQLIIITGPSGIGKSSLVKAGLLSLYKVEQTAENRVHEIRPGKTPHTTNTAFLQQLSKATTPQYLLVDQYEELVTLCEDKTEALQFEKDLLALLVHHKILITIRTDFEHQLKDSLLVSSQPPAGIKRHRFLVPPFTREEIREIVVQPAAQEVLTFRSIQQDEKNNERFINKIIDEAFQNPGSIPLLSMALSELYNRRDNDRNLLESAYGDFNGINGILDQKATQEFESLKDKAGAQELFKQLIERMITFEGGRIARRRVYTELDTRNSDMQASGTGNEQEAAQKQPGAARIDELVFEKAAKTTAIKEIASQLVKARLLNAPSDEEGRVFIEPVHEALLRSWPLLATWLRQKARGTRVTEQDLVQLHRTVSDAAFVYQYSDTETQNGYLDSWASHPRLDEVTKSIPDRLNAIEAAFIRLAVDRKNKIRRRNITWISAGAAAVVLLGIFGWVQANVSARESRKNKASFLTAASDSYGPTEAIRLLEASYAINPDAVTAQKISTVYGKSDYEIAFAYGMLPLDKAVNKHFPMQGGYLLQYLNKSVELIDSTGNRLLKVDTSVTVEVSADRQYFLLQLPNKIELRDSKGKLVHSFLDTICYLTAWFRKGTHEVITLTTDGKLPDDLFKVEYFNPDSKEHAGVLLKQSVGVMQIVTRVADYVLGKQTFLVYGSDGNDYRLFEVNKNGTAQVISSASLLEFDPHHEKMLLFDRGKLILKDYRTLKEQIRKIPVSKDELFWAGISHDGQTFFVQSTGNWFYTGKVEGDIPDGLSFTLPPVDIFKTTAVLNSKEKLLTIAGIEKIYRVDIEAKQIDSLAYDLPDAVNDNTLFDFRVSADKNNIMVTDGVRAAWFNSRGKRLRYFSQYYYDPQFTNSTGDSVSFLPVGRDCIYTAVVNWPRAEKQLLTPNYVFTTLHFTGDSNELQLLNTNSEKEIWPRLAKVSTYQYCYAKTDSGALLYKPDGTTSLLRVDKGEGWKLFYDARGQRALLVQGSKQETRLFYDDLKGTRKELVPLPGYTVYHVFFGDNELLISGDSVAQSYPYKKLTAIKRFPVPGKSPKRNYSFYNDSTMVYFSADSVYLSNIKGGIIWSWSDTNYIVEFAQFASGEGIKVVTRHRSSAAIDVKLFDRRNGRLLYSISANANEIDDMAFDAVNGRIFYIRKEKLLVHYLPDYILRSLPALGIPPLSDRLKQRFEL